MRCRRSSPGSIRVADAPSLKGVLMGKLVEDAKALFERNARDRERLEAGLTSETLVLLESKVELARWYPVERYTELTELLWREEGANQIEYLHRRGEDAMKRMMEKGLYQQLEFMTRREHLNRTRVPRELIIRAVRLVGSLSGTLRNFGKDSWEWHPKHPNHMIHHIREASHFPEVMRIVNDGAQTFLMRFSCPGAPPVTSERVTPDHIVSTSDYSLMLD